MADAVVLLTPTELKQMLVEAAHEAARSVLDEEKSSPWMGVKAAADYLDTTQSSPSSCTSAGIASVRSGRSGVIHPLRLRARKRP